MGLNLEKMFEDDPNDKCACKCAPCCCNYPNGVCIVISLQIIMFLATVLSWNAVLDCRFVTINPMFLDNFTMAVFPEDSNIRRIVNSDRGLGFYAWEGLDGTCLGFESYILSFKYQNLLGPDWQGPRSVSSLAAVLALVVLVVVFTFSCVAYAKAVRYTLGGFILIVVMTIIQSIAFQVLNTDFCNERSCKIGSSAVCGAVAVCLYAVTGVLMFSTKNYPGPRKSEQDSDEPNEEEPQQEEIEGNSVEVPLET